MQVPPVDFCLTSDASLTGWGRAMRGVTDFGIKTNHHINSLELLAALAFRFKMFLPYLMGKHVKILIDDIVAVSVVNRDLKIYNATGSTTCLEFQLENEP